jgi:hypothetical protein
MQIINPHRRAMGAPKCMSGRALEWFEIVGVSAMQFTQ